MSDVYAYRASDELAAALREYAQRDQAFCEQIEAFDRDNPGHELLWSGRGLSADRRPVGFKDGEDEVPPGLSRAKTRVELRPKKTKAGKPWQDVLDRMKERPKVDDVFSAFDVPISAFGDIAPSGGQYVCSTSWADAGPDGVLVVNGADLDRAPWRRHNSEGRGPHLTPIPLSEFYAIKERLDAEREVAA
jgi:hypothetical protein